MIDEEEKVQSSKLSKQIEGMSAGAALGTLAAISFFRGDGPSMADIQASITPESAFAPTQSKVQCSINQPENSKSSSPKNSSPKNLESKIDSSSILKDSDYYIPSYAFNNDPLQSQYTALTYNQSR